MYMDRVSHYTLTRASNGVWYYYAYDDSGRRIRRSTMRRSRREAENEIHRRIARGGLLMKPDVNRIARMTFQEFSRPFWVWSECPIIRDKLARGGHYSLDLCLSNRKSMEKHILPYFGPSLLSSITRKDVDRWILSLPQEHGITNSTANKMLSILKQMLNVAVLEGYIPESPAEKIRPLVENPRTRSAFSRDEVVRLLSLKWESQGAYVASFIAAFTGMRLGEIRALRVKDVANDHILVRHGWSDASGLKETKSGKVRVVPITERMHSLLISLCRDRKRDEFIFSRDGASPYGDRFFTEPLKQMIGKAEIESAGRVLSFHSFRHFFNTRTVAKGVSGEVLRAVIGHESEEMTDHYLHLSPEDLEPIRHVQLEITKDIRRR